MAAEVARRGELTELVANHIFGYVNWDELIAVVDSESVADELGSNHRRTAPSLDHRLFAALLHSNHLLLEFYADKGTFF